MSNEVSKIDLPGGVITAEPLPQPTSLRSILGLDGGRHKFFSNINRSERSGAVLLMRCSEEPTFRAEDVLSRDLLVTHYLVHTVDLENVETGEITTCPRTVLVLEDGGTVAFVSDGVLDSLQFLLGIVGLGPWNPPLTLQVKQARTRRGWKVTRLSLKE